MIKISTKKNAKISGGEFILYNIHIHCDISRKLRGRQEIKICCTKVSDYKIPYMHKCQTNLQLEFTLWYFIWVLHLVPTNFIINISYVWFGPLFSPIHNISFHMLVISYHLVQRRKKIQKSKKIYSKSKTSQLQRLWIEIGNSNIFQTCKKFSKFKSLWIKKICEIK